MISRKTWIVLVLTAVALSAFAVQPWAQDSESEDANPLTPCERLVGGEWYSDQNYQIFEWGVGKKSVNGTSYWVVDGEPKLVGEGFFFWHPGDEAIRGYFTGTEMGIDLFEYSVKWDGDRMIADLTTYGSMAGDFEEIWEFTSDSTFEWTLNQIAEDGTKSKMMGSTYTRR